MLRHRANAILVLVLPAILSACSEEQPKNILKEAIDVQGTCSEDHVGRRDQYSGQIVRWQMAGTGKINAYGFVFKNGDLSKQILDEAMHPNVYQTPYEITFYEVDIDTDQPKWVLHGVSAKGDGPEDDGYNSTCDLEVTKRGKEIRLQMDLVGAIKK